METKHTLIVASLVDIAESLLVLDSLDPSYELRLLEYTEALDLALSQGILDRYSGNNKITRLNELHEIIVKQAESLRDKVGTDIQRLHTTSKGITAYLTHSLNKDSKKG
jgi:hypothetical protein